MKFIKKQNSVTKRHKLIFFIIFFQDFINFILIASLCAAIVTLFINKASPSRRPEMPKFGHFKACVRTNDANDAIFSKLFISFWKYILKYTCFVFF